MYERMGQFGGSIIGLQNFQLSCRSISEDDENVVSPISIHKVDRGR